jgi:hypothetical protein
MDQIRIGPILNSRFSSESWTSPLRPLLRRPPPSGESRQVRNKRASLSAEIRISRLQVAEVPDSVTGGMRVLLLSAKG